MFFVRLNVITYLLLAALACPVLAESTDGKIYFRNFSGACNGAHDYDYAAKTIGWVRHDLSWNRIEPQQGQWDDQKLTDWAQKHVLNNQAHNITCLPILAYNTKWSTEKQNWSFERDGQVREYLHNGEGKYTCKISKKNSDGSLSLIEEKQVGQRGMYPMDESHVPDWQNYVRRAVSKLMAPPYNLKYFQIWNEAHPASGFYEGTLDSYMKRVHLPAAEIIHELGGKVVYGGWPCCGSLGQFVSLLDQYDAWKTIDVIDVHYFPVSAYAFLYREAQKRGIKHPYIWQTEFGFTTNPVALANAYPRILDWALRQNPVDQDQFKVLWFASWSPDDPKAYGHMHSLFAGSRLTGNGSTLKVMGDLFDNRPIQRYPDVITEPKLRQQEIDERLSGIESFRAGDRLIQVVHLSANNTAKLFTDWQGNGDTMHLDHGSPNLKITYPKLLARQITGAWRVDLEGNKIDLMPSLKQTDAGTQLLAPIRDEPKSLAHQWNNKTDRPRVFFVQVEYNPQAK
ncbi:MAG: hypothetical protein ACF8OB_14840 [Phycisphaeraceae bacterium JB051]